MEAKDRDFENLLKPVFDGDWRRQGGDAFPRLIYHSLIHRCLLSVNSVPTVVLGCNGQSLPTPELTVELRVQITHRAFNTEGDQCWEKGRQRAGGRWGGQSKGVVRWTAGQGGWGGQGFLGKSRSEGGGAFWIVEEGRVCWQKDQGQCECGE